MVWQRYAMVARELPYTLVTLPYYCLVRSIDVLTISFVRKGADDKGFCLVRTVCSVCNP